MPGLTLLELVRRAAAGPGMPSAYMDLASLGTLPKYTCGQLYSLQNFSAGRDRAKLTHEIRHNLARPTAWEAVMRIRCSKGLRISSFHGHFFIRSSDLLALPQVHAPFSRAFQVASYKISGMYVRHLIETITGSFCWKYRTLWLSLGAQKCSVQAIFLSTMSSLFPRTFCVKGATTDNVLKIKSDERHVNPCPLSCPGGIQSSQQAEITLI